MEALFAIFMFGSFVFGAQERAELVATNEVIERKLELLRDLSLIHI